MLDILMVPMPLHRACILRRSLSSASREPALKFEVSFSYCRSLDYPGPDASSEKASRFRPNTMLDILMVPHAFVALSALQRRALAEVWRLVPLLLVIRLP
jgi:hypothetical protein